MVPRIDPSRARSLLVVAADPVDRETFSKLLSPLGTVVASGSFDRPPAFDAAVFDYDLLTLAERSRATSLLKSEMGRSMVLVGAAGARRDLGRLFTEARVAHLVARNDGRVDADELVVTVRKILGEDPFGIESYFPSATNREELSISDSSRKGEVVAQAERFAGRFKVSSRIANLLCNVTDELVANALYDAPVDSSGHRCFAQTPRSEKVALPPPQEVRVKLCGDEKRLGVSVTDPFGSLNADDLQANLGRCLHSGTAEALFKPGGAGLGLYLVFQSVSQVVVNLSPGKRTEVIGIIDPSISYREFAAVNKSVNVFVAPADPLSSRPSAPPA